MPCLYTVRQYLRYPFSPHWPINSIKSHIMIIEGFGIKSDKMILSYTWKCNDSKYSHNNHEIYNKSGELTLPDFMTH